MNITTKKIVDALKKNSYPLFTGENNITLVGVRSKDTNSNSFNDALVVLCEVEGKMQSQIFDITTDPGIYYRENPLNVDGTAVLVPGHYKSCWKLGAHRGQYHALIQAGEMSVYRDNNHDSKIDTKQNAEGDKDKGEGEEKDNIDKGLFGINLHRANEHRSSLRVDRWSAGCQVMANPKDFDLVMGMLKDSAKVYGDKYSYSLLNEAEL